MNTTPLWVPLLVAGLGVLGTLLGTLGGVLITQRRSDKREALAWERQREREREVRAREDAARTFDHRREAYSDFFESLKAMALRAYNHGLGIGNEPPDEDGDLPEGWQFPTFQKLQRVEMYGTPDVYVSANEAYSAVWWWGHTTKFGVAGDDFYAAQEAADAKEAEVLLAIRRDLAIPEQ